MRNTLSRPVIVSLAVAALLLTLWVGSQRAGGTNAKTSEGKTELATLAEKVERLETLLKTQKITTDTEDDIQKNGIIHEVKGLKDSPGFSNIRQFPPKTVENGKPDRIELGLPVRCGLMLIVYYEVENAPDTNWTDFVFANVNSRTPGSGQEIGFDKIPRHGGGPIHQGKGQILSPQIDPSVRKKGEESVLDLSVTVPTCLGDPSGTGRTEQPGERKIKITVTAVCTQPIPR